MAKRKPQDILTTEEEDELKQVIEKNKPKPLHDSYDVHTALMYGGAVVGLFLQQRLFMNELLGGDRHCEFEVRLGKITNGKFNSGVDKAFFSQLLTLVEAAASKSDAVIGDWEESEVRYYDNNLRSHHVAGKPVVYEHSKRTTKRDLYHDGPESYDLRFALKTEQQLTHLPAEAGKVVSKRLKKRKSISHKQDGVRVDFTVASLTKKGHVIKESYEIELELEAQGDESTIDCVGFFRQAVHLLGKGDASLTTLRLC